MSGKLSFIALPRMSSVWINLAPLPAAAEPINPISWIWVLVALLLLLPLVWWLYRSLSPETSHKPVSETPKVEGELMEHVPAAEAPAVAAIADAEEPALRVSPATRSPHAVAIESTSPDDLVIIEGIGPKISALLQANGINTFARLATTELGQIEQLLQQAGLRNIANPATWPEQAQLAADGKWDELKALQAELKGGRRK